jgi:glycosyltransferase involved in cell wall biosynthesis
MVAACPFPARRGTPVRIQGMAEVLARRGHRVHLVTYHHGSGAVDPALVVHRIPNVRSYQKLSPGPSYSKLLMLDPLLARTLRRVIREQDVDIIHAHHFEGLLVGAAARLGTGIPLVFDVHTLLGSELPYHRMPFLPAGVKRVAARVCDRHLPGRADFVTTATDRIRDKLLELRAIPEDRVLLLPNGVETRVFDAAAAADGGHAPGERRHLIFTGNLAPYQGVDLLLAALRKVLDRRTDVRLTIVTETSFEPYERLASELGITGSVEVIQAPFTEVPRLLAAADVAVNPRIDCDGIPIKLLNYMAAGKAVVSFAGSAPVLRHLDTGWIVPDGDVDAFADGALRLLGDADLSAELGRNARRHVEVEHGWDRTAEVCEEIYHQLLEVRAPGRV